MSIEINNRIIDFFSGHTGGDAPECVLLDAVQSLMPDLTKPRILSLAGGPDVTPDDVGN